jgi:glycosyltransferase involved in cell wall biosynthesis
VPLANAGVVPTVACFHGQVEGVEHLLGGVEVRILAHASRAAQMAELRGLARDRRFDLIHTTLFEADVFGRPAFFGLDIPVVTSLVNMPYEPARLENDPNVNRHKLAVARWLEIVTGRLCATHFHAITEAVKRSAIERLKVRARDITVVHRGRDPRRLGRRTAERRQRVREQLGIPESGFVILNAARQEFQKGQRYLLDAFRLVLARRPDAWLLIAGRTGNASHELQVAAQGLGDRVRFLGHREDVPELMVGADAFALPSLWEGLGCVLIEAMALELPIVATDLEPVREVASTPDAALLVPPKQSARLADALLQVASDAPTARRMSLAGRALFESSFTLEHSARGMFELFQTVLNNRKMP